VARRVPAPGRRQAAAQAAPSRLGCRAHGVPAPQGIVLALLAANFGYWAWDCGGSFG